MSINQNLQSHISLHFVKKEEGSYKDKPLYYFHCNFFDQDGMASPIKVKVSQDIFNQKFQSGDVVDVLADIQGDYLRVTALSVKKVK
jgi:hypothetical protein